MKTKNSKTPKAEVLPVQETLVRLIERLDGLERSAFQYDVEVDQRREKEIKDSEDFLKSLRPVLESIANSLQIIIADAASKGRAAKPLG